MISLKTSILLSALIGLVAPAPALADPVAGVTTKNLPAYRTRPALGTILRNPLAAPPTDAVTPDTGDDWRMAGSSGAPANGFSPRAFGSFGIPYASFRVQAAAPAAGATEASGLSTTFPYRAIGKLTFTGNGSTYACSASLIMRSVMVTAAHCAGNFGSGALFGNWVFRPGHWGGPGATAAQLAPFGAWTMQAVAVSPTWLKGTDTGTGAARNNDLAVFIVRKNDTDQFIGDVLGGWLKYGWNNFSFVRSAKTGNLRTAAISSLGYPALLDYGAIMQRTDGPTYTTTVGGALQLWQGSNYTGGASGGPWIANFGFAGPVLSGGAVPGTAAAPNRVVGVTSWGSPNPNAPKDNFSSQFGQNAQFPNASYGSYGAGNIGALLNALCSSRPAGSSSTYAALGYCNR